MQLFILMIELFCEYLSVWHIWLRVLTMPYTRFIVILQSVITGMSRNSLLETGAISEVLSGCNRIWIHNHLCPKRTLNHLAKLDITPLLSKEFLDIRQQQNVDSLWKAYVAW